MMELARNGFEDRMIGRRRLLAGLGGLVLASAFARGSLAAAPKDFQDGAKRHVESLASDAIATLSTQGVGRVQLVERFRGLVDEYFDLPTIGRWVFGDAWTKASREQRMELLRLFGDLAVRNYIERFGGYSGEKLAVTGTEAVADGDVAVHSVVTHATRSPVKVDWRVRAMAGRYRIVDVTVGGVSLGKTQRSEVSSLLRLSGGRVDLFLDDLRSRVADVAASRT